ncbi:hypothetical protein EVAR_12715_1 [Eumeta japonica]|uniref:Uncharacterized protein n=1 Tax=Eumeta variegata TaxID=151549 RepID=A0A4C1UMK8_EUMVA|nr:hypothetical protein EVAR_12715_1 [Eumeta japonica]
MMDDNTQTEDYLPMGPDVVAQQVQQQLVHQPLDCGYMDVQRTLSPAASSGSVCSGTPSTDPRFSHSSKRLVNGQHTKSVLTHSMMNVDKATVEYNLERAVSHIQPDEEERPPRAYSVGSRPAAAARPAAEARMRAYSVGARTKHTPHHHHTVTHHTTGKTSSSAPLLPGGSADDLMVLDFSNNSPKTKPAVVRTPPQRQLCVFGCPCRHSALRY